MPFKPYNQFHLKTAITIYVSRRLQAGHALHNYKLGYVMISQMFHGSLIGPRNPRCCTPDRAISQIVFGLMGLASGVAAYFIE